MPPQRDADPLTRVHERIDDVHATLQQISERLGSLEATTRIVCEAGKQTDADHERRIRTLEHRTTRWAAVIGAVAFVLSSLGWIAGRWLFWRDT